MFFKKDPAKELRVLMAALDISTQELAYISGVSDTTISGIRTGRIKKPKRGTIDAICEALNVHPNKIWPNI